MSDIEQFKVWKLHCKRIMKDLGFCKAWIQHTDWQAWREEYYDDGLSPGDAVDVEIDAAMQCQ